MKKIYLYLSYMGTLPFIFCAVCFIEDINIVPFLGSTDMIVSGYGLVISSFLAGSHWGQHLSISGKWDIYLPVFSTINSILLWLSFIILSFKILIFIFGVSFLSLLLIDNKLYQRELISLQYFRTRCFVSLIVILSLIISGIYA